MPQELPILDALMVGIILLDPDGRVLFWNDWMEEASGHRCEDMLGQDFLFIFPSAAGTALDTAIKNALEKDLSTVLSRNLHPGILPLRVRRAGGVAKSIEQSIVVRPIGTGDRRQCVIQIVDVSSAVRREAHLRDMAAYSRMLFDVGIDPLGTVDWDGIITDANAAFSLATGRERAELIGTRFADYFTDPDVLDAAIKTAWTCGSESGTPLRLRHRDGHCIDVLFSFTVFHVPGGRFSGLLASGRDITDQIKASRQLEILATTDSLTGLANRGHFIDLAEREVIRSQRYCRDLSLFILDLDLFKTINDSYGHSAGDEVLRKVAEVCHQTVRTSDVAGRLGGEELAILMPETEIDGAAALGERLREAIANLLVPVRGSVVSITTSIGLAALWPNESLEDFLIRADNALYSAKHQGRNCLVVDRRMHG